MKPKHELSSLLKVNSGLSLGDIERSEVRDPAYRLLIPTWKVALPHRSSHALGQAQDRVEQNKWCWFV